MKLTGEAVNLPKLLQSLEQHLKDCVDYIEMERRNTPRCKEWKDANHFLLYDWLESKAEVLRRCEDEPKKQARIEALEKAVGLSRELQELLRQSYSDKASAAWNVRYKEVSERLEAFLQKDGG